MEKPVARRRYMVANPMRRESVMDAVNDGGSGTKTACKVGKGAGDLNYVGRVKTRPMPLGKKCFDPPHRRAGHVPQ